MEIYHIGLDTADLAVDRVMKRVEKGGHGIPEDDIRRRYEESLRALKELIPLCDIVRVYDNSEFFHIVAFFSNGECLYKAKPLPEWCKKVFE